MKVLHVVPSLSYKLGGPTEAALNFVRHLIDLGIDTEIATTNDDVDGLLEVPLNQRSTYAGVPVWFFPRLARLKAYMPSLSLSRWLIQHIKDYDLIHNHYLFCCAPTVASLVAGQRGVPYVNRSIGQLTPWALSQSATKKQIYGALIERPLLNRASAIHCTTDDEAQDVGNYGVKTSKLVIPLGVNPPTPIPEARTRLRQRYSLDPEVLIVVFLSRLHEKKRPDFLLEIFANLDRGDQPRHLLMAGTGEQSYCDYLRIQVQRLGLADQVTFTGFVSGFDKDLLLQGADMFTLPSYSENFGIAVVEALAAGLPVVITPDVQIAPDIKAAKAGLVVQGDLNSWVKALNALLEPTAMRADFGKNGKQLAGEKFSWPSIARQLAQSYQEILSGKPLSLQYHGFEDKGTTPTLAQKL